VAHVNPYTGLSYVADPCVAVIEINNENSLTGWPGDRLGFFDQLPEPFRGELVGFWNDWLKKTYRSEKALRTAWMPAPTGKLPPPLLTGANPTKWDLEDRTTAAKLIETGPATADGPAPIQVDVPVKPDADWNVQVKLDGLDIVEGVPYVLSFRAKADTARQIKVYASIDQADWHGLGLSDEPSLTTDWQTFRVVFSPKSTIANHDRIVFVAGGATGSVWISDVKLRPAGSGDALPSGETLANGNIDIPVAGTALAAADWTRFLVDTERSYANEMRGYLHGDLGVKTCMVDSQMEYGGLSSFSREAASDYADGHAYWQHPKFPGKPWDPVNWLIDNTPLENDLAASKPVTLNRVAFDRVAGRPFTVSEYNHPAPSDYQSNMIPILSTYAALQDWDMVFPFEYGRYDGTQPRDRIQSFFAVAQNPAKETFFPTAALILRAGAISPLKTAMTLNIAPASIEAGADTTKEWTEANHGKPIDLLSARIQSRVASNASTSKITVDAPPGPAGSIARVIKNTSGAIYTVQGEDAVAATGFIGGQTTRLGAATFAIPTFGNNFAALTLASVDLLPIPKSKRMLLTIVGRADNLDMGWNAARTSVGNQWGHGPAQAEGIPATVTLANSSVTHVWVLDTAGARSKEIPVTTRDGKATFTIGPEDATVWYEIAN
jgi:hypothetical protein